MAASVSDHLPLRCSNKPITIDKEEYEMRVAGSFHSVQGGTDSLNSLDINITKLNEILVKEAQDLQPTRPKAKRRPKLAVWISDIKQAIRDKKKAFWYWKKENLPTEKENELVICKKLITQNLRKMCRMESARQREARRQEILDAKHEDSRLFHRLIKKQKGRLKQCVNEHVNGNIYHTETDIMEGFREHFQALATTNEVPGVDKKYCNLCS